MEEIKKNDNKSIVLEGMYNGVAGKIDEVRKTVSKELQFSSAQQVTAYEALADEIQDGVDAVLSELRYLSEQNSTIYDFGHRERDAMMVQILTQLAELSAKIDSKAAPTVEGGIDYDLLADKVTERLRATRRPIKRGEEEADFEDELDYDILAEKIMAILPEEPDYEELLEKVVASIPQVDEQAIVDKVIAALPQVSGGEGTVQHITYNTPDPDYDVIAQKVAAALEQDDTVKLSGECIEQIAQRVAELLRAEDSDIERIVREVVVVPSPEPVAEPAPEPEPEPVKVEEIAVAEAAPAPAPVVIVTPAPAPAPAPVVVAEPAELTTRYKRSFVAKIIESDEDIKKYYSDMKNVILAYSKVRSQINWSNDRFSLGQDSVVKIGIRGKTLCVYLALDCNEFPESIYHQTFAGDTKMYEKTPMMVKVKSHVAVKRAVRLIELLMERLGAVKEEHEYVDYAAQYFFRTEEELLAEGLIKTAVVEKSDMKF